MSVLPGKITTADDQIETFKIKIKDEVKTFEKYMENLGFRVLVTYELKVDKYGKVVNSVY